MITTTLIVALALALVGAGAVALIFGLVKTPFALIGSAVSALIKPIKGLFKKGGDKAAKAGRKAKSGVEEVSTPAAAAAAA